MPFLAGKACPMTIYAENNEACLWAVVHQYVLGRQIATSTSRPTVPAGLGATCLTAWCTCRLAEVLRRRIGPDITTGATTPCLLAT